MALMTHDIFATMTELKARSYCGGFDFMPRPSDSYYKELPGRIGESLTVEQYAQVQQLGLLVDKDDQGVLVQASSSS
jgi:4-hydroxyphenylpyruvate dioxygenase